MRLSSLASSSDGRAASKMTPEIGGSLDQVLVAGELLVAIDGHCQLLIRLRTSTARPEQRKHRAHQAGHRNGITHLSV